MEAHCNHLADNSDEKKKEKLKAANEKRYIIYKGGIKKKKNLAKTAMKRTFWNLIKFTFNLILYGETLNFPLLYWEQCTYILSYYFQSTIRMEVLFRTKKKKGITKQT